MRVQDLGTLSYREAWALQESAHAEVLAGGEERILFVEHPPVITFGRRPGIERNLIASDEQLTAMGVEVVQSDRGGDITFHGPGQIVAYPIIRLADHGLSVSGYVRLLEQAMIDMLAQFRVVATAREQGAVGVWVDNAKIGAVGVRIRRGVRLHGIALNVTTDLRYFQLIVPCGLVGRPVTSLTNVLDGVIPAIVDVRARLSQVLVTALAGSPLPAQ